MFSFTYSDGSVSYVTGTYFQGDTKQHLNYTFDGSKELEKITLINWCKCVGTVEFAQLEENDHFTGYQPYNGVLIHDKQLTEQLSNYLPLAGGTMTGIITSIYASGTWINGVTNAVIKGAYTGYGAILSMPVKDGRVSLSSYPSNNNYLYFGYATTAQINAGTNSFNKQMYWDAANNNLHADVFTGALSGNASTATKL